MATLVLATPFLLVDLVPGGSYPLLGAYAAWAAACCGWCWLSVLSVNPRAVRRGSDRGIRRRFSTRGAAVLVQDGRIELTPAGLSSHMALALGRRHALGWVGVRRLMALRPAASPAASAGDALSRSGRAGRFSCRAGSYSSPLPGSSNGSCGGTRRRDCRPRSAKPCRATIRRSSMGAECAGCFTAGPHGGVAGGGRRGHLLIESRRRVRLPVLLGLLAVAVTVPTLDCRSGLPSSGRRRRGGVGHWRSASSSARCRSAARDC